MRYWTPNFGLGMVVQQARGACMSHVHEYGVVGDAVGSKRLAHLCGVIHGDAARQLPPIDSIPFPIVDHALANSSCSCRSRSVAAGGAARRTRCTSLASTPSSPAACSGER